MNEHDTVIVGEVDLNQRQNWRIPYGRRSVLPAKPNLSSGPSERFNFYCSVIDTRSLTSLVHWSRVFQSVAPRFSVVYTI